MDATDSAININANKKIERLTVLSVVFMPINVLAGMGGMSEFSVMADWAGWQGGRLCAIHGLPDAGRNQHVLRPAPFRETSTKRPRAVVGSSA